MKIKHLLCLFFFCLGLLSINSSYGQYFNPGQDRATISWYRIRTLHFEVIFPEGFERQGDHVARLMETAYQYASQSLGHYPKKVSVILHTETVKSNAFLGWAPGRIEMYTTPHQGIYSQDWLEQLALHEFRHMVQLGKLESEMPKVLRFLLGEQAAAILTAAYLPFWFIEGDAVSAETGLSNSGRGRQPDFLRELKAQLIEKGKYSYDKAYLGSYKDWVPNYYQMGYHLVGGTRRMFDKIVWDSVMHHVARNPFSFTAFEKGLKKSTGYNQSALYDTVFSLLRQEWMAEKEINNVSQVHQLSPLGQNYSSYSYVSILSGNRYFAERFSLDDVIRFVVIDSMNKEKVLFTPGYHFRESVSANEKKVIWSERLPHIRWEHADRSLIRMLDSETNQLSEFDYGTKLFAPSLSPDNQYFLAVEADRFYQFYLSLFSAKTGERIRQIHLSDNEYLITPSWSSDGQSVYSVLLRHNQKGIAKIDTEGGNVEMVFPYGNYELSKPKACKGYVFFIAGFSGTDLIYAIKPEEKALFRVIESQFGISDFDINEDVIVYNDYTSNGFRIMKSNIYEENFKRVSLDTLIKQYPIAEALSSQEAGTVDFSNGDDISYNVEEYSKPLHLFNFHSWAPLSIDPYNYRIYPGLSLMSQNMLGTAETTMGYRYLWEESRGEWYLKFRYLGWYPIIDVEANHGKSKSSYYAITHYLNQDQTINRIDTLKKDYSWHETDILIKTYIPFNFSKGRSYRGIYPKFSYQLADIVNIQNAPKSFQEGSYHTIETGIYAFTILQSSRQDLLPDFGLVLDVSYATSLPGIFRFGDIFSFAGTVYLPGIKPNHGLQIYGGYQVKKTAEFTYNDRIRIPRGHTRIENNQMITFTADYLLPLFYPDLNIGRWSYIKRFKMNIFYDVTYFRSYYQSDSTNENFQFLQSAGFEFTSDMHVLRFIAPIEVGLRSSYLFNGSFDFDFLFSMKFSL